MVETKFTAKIEQILKQDSFEQLQLLLFNLLIGLVPGIQHPSHHGVSDGAAALLDFCWPPVGAAVRRIRGICQREFTVVRPSSNLLSQFLHWTLSFRPRLGINNHRSSWLFCLLVLFAFLFVCLVRKYRICTVYRGPVLCCLSFFANMSSEPIKVWNLIKLVVIKAVALDS